MIGLNAFSGSVIVNDVNAECNYEVRTSKNILIFLPGSLCFFSTFLSLVSAVIFEFIYAFIPFS